ncbi:energy-coupling factor ABC transporter permease [Maricurvus nonylphenolicus]|uniref:energy-coupling factor ABC transporter permease n=1 Tax=Maricurvus nonylphenolicus TaxID=1008307 RepID=UPI0036F3B178
MPILIWAAIKAPWHALTARQERQHLLFFSLLFYSFFWSMDIHAGEQLRFHLLGVTTAVLVFGWHLAVVIGCAAIALSGVWLGVELQTLGTEALFTVIIPVTLVQGIFHLVSAIPNINLFAYTIGVGFLGSVLSVLLLSGLAWMYINLFGSDGLATTFNEYGYILLLMAFPEGFINGAMVSMLAVFRPDLLRTLDEKRLIDDQ